MISSSSSNHCNERMQCIDVDLIVAGDDQRSRGDEVVIEMKERNV